MGFPNSPTNNQEETINGVKYRYNSTLTAWIRVPVSGLSKFTTSTTPPGDPAPGDQWYDTNLDILFEYINDGTSNYWVDIQSLGQTGNIVTIADSTLQGNIVVGVGNVYSIGTSNGFLRNIFANTATFGNITTTNGLFWSNGTAFSSGLNSAQVNARIWAQKLFWG